VLRAFILESMRWRPLVTPGKPPTLVLDLAHGDAVAFLLYRLCSPRHGGHHLGACRLFKVHHYHYPQLLPGRLPYTCRDDCVWESLVSGLSRMSFGNTRQVRKGPSLAIQMYFLTQTRLIWRDG
jgi:hypothetical protein